VTRSLHVVGNVQLDVIASPVHRLPAPGGDDVVDHIAVRPAGAAGNVSLALAALGVDHRLFGAVGDDQAGRWVAQELRGLGVGGDLHVVAGEETGISIALEAPGRERAFVTAHGVLTGYGVDALPQDVTAADFLLLTGYFSMPGFRGEGTGRLLREARGRGAFVGLDTGWDPEDWSGPGVAEVLGLLPLLDLFLPNEPEALALTGTSNAERAIEVLAQRCPGWVVLKLGERGVLASGPAGETFSLGAPTVTAKDTTGAGDSLAAGVLAELVRGVRMEDALVTGVRVASTVVSRDSRNRYPTRDELVELV
jgi:argininosuccinate lyase